MKQQPDTTEVTTLIDSIAERENQLAVLRAALDKELIRVREKRGDAIKELEDDVRRDTKEARKLATKQRSALLGDKLSGETKLARFGFEKKPPSLKLASGVSEADVIANIQQGTGDIKKLEGVAIVVTEKLNRRALANLTDDDLESIGLKRTQSTTFFIEPKQDNGARQTA